MIGDILWLHDGMGALHGPVKIHRVDAETVAFNNMRMAATFAHPGQIEGETPTRAGQWYAAMRSAQPSDAAIVVPPSSLAILRRVGRCVVDVGHGIPPVNAEYLALLACLAAPPDKVVLWGEPGEVPVVRAMIGQSTRAVIAACASDAVRVLLNDVAPYQAKVTASDYNAQVLAATLALGGAMRAHDRAADDKLRVGALRRTGGATQDELEVAHDNNRRARGLVMDAREALDALLLAGPEKGDEG